ncbi:cysteine proteinase inhibitor 1 [Cocos nucifera]|nr:cysteine proteinase inhibitor 1 [Cocos nucifera]
MSKALLGGWQPIKNVNDAHVQEIAKFAVSEHNKLANTRLAFSKVVKGETQVVSGINYRLVVEAKNGGTTAKYEAVVWEKAWEGFRKLTSFEPVNS